jgi:CBS domain-containing protein
MQKTISSIIEGKGRDVFSVSPGDSVLRVIELMNEFNVGAVVVMEEERLVGILSERDIARRFVKLDTHPSQTKVAEIMTSEVLTIGPDATVVDCMELMTEHRVRHLPVMDGDRVTGVVSIGDIVKAVIEQQRELINELERYITS